MVFGEGIIYVMGRRYLSGLLLKEKLLFSTWGYVDNAVSRITIEAMSEAALYCMPKQKLEKLFASSVDFANLGRKLF